MLIPGAVLVVIGTIFRARVVPVWVPIGLLFSILTLLVPGSGVLGLITGLPM